MNPTPLARLLIVDDESAQVIALCHTLAAAGYATSGAGSGPEALCALRTAAPDRATAFDVLVTDLMMPDMDGIALLRAAQGIDPDLVGLVMTGHGTVDTAVAAMKSGALDYILKPFNLRTIIPVLSRALAVRRLRQQPLERETVNVGTMVREILDQLRDAEPHRNVELRVSALPDARADSALVRQVLVNLLSNAFKFTRRVPDPVIEVDGRQQAGECTYTIRDNGAGFDMRNAQRLFAIFHRLHSERDFEGNGVGLSIAQRIVERHGGRIWAEAAVGQGAKFTFTLPA